MSLSQYLKHSRPFYNVIDIATLCVQTFKAYYKFHELNSIAINALVKCIAINYLIVFHKNFTEVLYFLKFKSLMLEICLYATYVDTKLK